MFARRTLSIIVGALLVLSTTSLRADEPGAGETLNAETAFKKLTTLTGKWVDESKPDNEAEAITFRVTGAGSAVMATFYPGTPMEMISMFHLDGPDELIHTHYCALGNQPRMRLEKCDEPNVLNFVFDGGTNMDAEKDLHVHNTRIRILDDNRIEAEVDAYNEGKLAETNKFVVIRRPDTPADTAQAEAK